MFRLSAVLSASIGALALTACGDRAPSDDPPANESTDEFADAETVTWDCDGTEIVTRIMGERARIEFDSQTYDLDRIETAEGARFEAAGDSDLFFWERGDMATVSRPEMPEDMDCTRQ